MALTRVTSGGIAPGVEIKFKVGDSLDLNSVTFTVGG